MASGIKEKVRVQREEFVEEALVRILATDIPGNKSIYTGLTRIRGVSWAFSNALCYKLGIPKGKKVSDLNAQEIEKINLFLKNPKMPEWLLNRRKDYETGVTKHLVTGDLDMAKENDIRRLKKIKSYKGWRHATGQPVRGQRTKSHFRSQGAVGVQKGKSAKAVASEAAAKKK